MGIFDDILPAEYWLGAQTCPQCGYRIAQTEEYEQKAAALRAIRYDMARTSYRGHEYKIADDWRELLRLLEPDGRFSDLSDDAANTLCAARRLANLTAQLRFDNPNAAISAAGREKILRSIVHYCTIEAERPEKGRERFHLSVFQLPTCTVNMYFDMLPDMEAAERGEGGELLRETARALARCSLQCWTLPLRGDHTDLHPVSPERLRGHAWWESGNALGYRLLLHTAALFLSVEMVDVFVFAAVKSASVTSHTTNAASFWREGFCADGAGWAHGRQAAFQGYPSDGLRYTLRQLKYLIGTPWEKELYKFDFDVIMDFVRAMTWDQYKGHRVQPITGRIMFRAEDAAPTQLEYIDICANLVMYFAKFLTAEQLAELRALHRERFDLEMEGFPRGYYTGTRYFWNNDIMVRKTAEDYFIVHMASSRSDGVEYCCAVADRFNFFAADGAYLIMKNGDEYIRAKGAFRLCETPGVTAREISNDRLIPGINWSGFHSRHGFAGGAVRGDYGVCAFVFEKDKTVPYDAAGVPADAANPEIYDVAAHKAYFIFGETVVCLGAGIKNLAPELAGDICTSVNQTELAGEVVCETDDGDEVITPNRELRLDAARTRCVRHNGIRYSFYPDFSDTDVLLSAQNRMTSLYLLNEQNKGITDSFCPMFGLKINHKRECTDGRYAYSMNMGEGAAPRVVENSARVQAVCDGGAAAAVFYEKDAACTLNGYEISASERAVVLVTAEETGVYVTVSDPMQCAEAGRIFVSVKKAGTDERACACVELPDGENTGKAATTRADGAFSKMILDALAKKETAV